MERLAIKKLNEWDDDILEQAVKLFVVGFLHELIQSMKIEAATLVAALKHSFRKDHYWVAVQDGKAVGILAVSTSEGRSHAFDGAILRRELGLFKGGIVRSILYRELQKPMSMPTRQGYIESVTTAEEARGQGVASRLLRHIFDTAECDEFVLEVMDTNTSAIRLYERLGFVLFDKKKAGYFLRKMGINERLYMKRTAAAFGQ